MRILTPQIPYTLTRQSMILRTEAIILRHMNYGETSQIITAFTREKGKISLLAKGARTIKSKFGASLQPLSYSQIVFYHKTTRDLQTLSDSSLLVPFPQLNRDLGKMSMGMQVVELVHQVMEDEQPNVRLFKLLLETLATLNDAVQNIENILPYFSLRLAMLLGFEPDIQKKWVEALAEDGGWFRLDTGAIVPTHTASAGIRASKSALRALAILAKTPLGTILNLVLTPEIQREVTEMTAQYLQYHIENLHTSRARKVFGEMAIG